MINAKWRKPAALLINAGTRSGKEVLAYGFKKYGYGPVIGTRTAARRAGRAGLPARRRRSAAAAGCGRAVDGERLEGRGVTPTIEIPFDIPYAAGADSQLERAIDELGARSRWLISAPRAGARAARQMGTLPVDHVVARQRHGVRRLASCIWKTICRRSEGDLAAGR